MVDVKNKYGVIIVGGGHAGAEAAMAAARIGVKTLLLTDNLDTVGAMSCNPAIGGIGKGHLVKEIDALGGLMARAADLSGIQFRILNSSKGPAVRATRAQADRTLYKSAVRSALENQGNLFLFQQSVSDLIIEKGQVAGVVTLAGIRFHAPAVVLTVGTFLGGVIHIGLKHFSGGRAGEAACIPLAQRLRELPFQVDRLKTGTPPRIDSRSIDYSVLTGQAGDTPVPVFSFLGHAEQHPRQVLCHIARTTQQTHDIIQRGLNQSPMYTGMIEGVGPRYCPSIEDKVVRFSDKNSHQIFVEPEGLNTHEVYPNGISTSLPYEVQYQFVRSISGFENAHIIRPGYAIEYDFFDPRGLKSSLETQFMPGLFFAGQINGTTGYEEAAAQGLLAGLNAARSVRGQEAWCPGREEAYLGVMVDDLITRGTQEPYRMFTSRAEYRLLLREDNADMRLTTKGRELGLVDDQRWAIFQRKCVAIEHLQSSLGATWITVGSPQAETVSGLLKKPLTREASLQDLLRRPEVHIEHLRPFSNALQQETDQQVTEQVEIQTKYAGYVERQQAEVKRTRRYQNTQLPDNIDYNHVHGLSNEVREKLQQKRPETVGQASRISGMTPAAISLLLIHLKKQPLNKKTA